MGTAPPSLWSYCSSLNRLCPKLMPVTKIYADLRWSTTLFTARSMDHTMGCTQGSGPSADGVCHVVAQLSTWNEVFVIINMELCEAPPGKLSLVCLREMSGFCGLAARERHATILLHWLLTVHRCVTSIELDDSVIPNFSTYFSLYSDALQRSLSIRDLKVSAWSCSRDASRSLVNSIVCKRRLEALRCEALDLSVPDFREYLESSVTLKELSVAYTIRRPDNPSVILNSLRFNSSLAHLSIHSDCLDADKKNWFGDYMERTATLRYIKITNFSRGPPRSLVPVFHALSNNNSVLTIDLVLFNLGIDEAWSFADLINVNHNLRIVNFIACIWSFAVYPRQYILASTCSTPEVGHTYRAAMRTAPLVCAFGPESSLEEITLDMSSFNACEQKTLLYAVSQNTTLKKVNVERLNSGSAISLCEAIRETGTADRVHLDLVNVRGRELARVKRSCAEATEIALFNIGAHGTRTRRECLTALTLCTHLTVLNLDTDGRVCEAEAHLLSMFLRQSQCIRELYLYLKVRPDALRDILQGLSMNTALEKLGISKCGLDKQNAATLACIVGDSQTIRHFDYQTHCVASCRLLLLNLARCLQSNTSLVSLEISEYRAVMRYSAAVRNFVRRNAALVDGAAHFVLGTRNKHCAEAFERVASGRGIVARVQEMAAEPCADRASAMIREATRWLLGMGPFMKMAGVVKNDLSWDESVDYRERLQTLPLDCWLHVRQFIKVRDVLHWAPSTSTWRKRAFWRAPSRARRSKQPRLQS
ncbi:hypothetical protein HPB49_006600 [Dermacentor silvarum]|uniref:Uncharacterized protein n=1 Tax=Dermacentor silvarum TaxID=543639 RepID=A0ACB8DWT8_DERSI|nr:uncharacterized protein LOC125942172 [Dermacentor silvarum]KAH7978746.1 hypothetical protein HPB49_006600 [Dermacentor silvarum]